MAKCIIEFEDNPNGSVKITATPSFAQMCQIVESGAEKITPAHNYFMKLLRTAMEYSKKPYSESDKILIPRIGRA